MKTRALVAMVALAALASCASDTRAKPEASPTGTASSAADTVPVVRIIDGDTIVVAIGRSNEKVRLIGIDTPERDRCMYRTATDRMRALVEGRGVRLEKDVSETDVYGRLLRYVYIGDLFVNAAMVSDGYAAAATFPPDVAHAMELQQLEGAARRAGKGLWAKGTCAP